MARRQERLSLLFASLLLVGTAGLTGCIGNAGEGGEIETASENASSSGAAALDGNATPNPIDVQLSHDFTDESESIPFEVPENGVVSTQQLYFGPASTPGPSVVPDLVCANAGQDATIVVIDPAGNTVYDLVLSGGVQASVGGPCGSNVQQTQQPAVPIAPGTWTVHFNGTALATGHVILTG